MVGSVVGGAVVGGAVVGGAVVGGVGADVATGGGVVTVCDEISSDEVQAAAQRAKPRRRAGVRAVFTTLSMGSTTQCAEKIPLRGSSTTLRRIWFVTRTELVPKGMPVAPSVVLRSIAERSPLGFFRRLATLLLASTLVMLLAGTALASIDASRPMMAQVSAERSWVPGDAPDLSFVVADALIEGSIDPVITASVAPSLAEVPGVTAVAIDVIDNGRVALHVSLADPAASATIDAVERTADRLLDGKQVSVGGRAAIDRDLLDRLNRGALIAVIPVIVLLGLVVAASVGPKLGVAAASVVALASGLGGMFGARVAGTFDGTLASTAIPAVFVAVLVSCVLTFRLLDWFRHPQGTDQADIIRNAVRHLLPETGLLFGGLVATAIVMELTSPGRASSTVVAAGGIIATIVTLASLPAILATLPPVPNDDEYRLFRLPTPDGRDFPLPVLAGFACFLLALGLFATRAPSDTLLDGDALPSGEASRRVAEQLVQSGGDPTDAIVASIATTETDAVSLDGWASSVSEIPTVGWVETSNGRYVDGALVIAGTTPERFVADDTTFAIVSPMVSGRSNAALQLVAEIEETSAAAAFIPELAGVPVDAADTASAATSGLWVLVLMLALTGGLAVYFLLSDIFLAAVTVGLRLLGTAASLGVYSLLTSDVSGSELQVLALVVNVGVGLFEIGFLRRISIGLAESGSPDVLVGDALRREGRAAMFGLGVTALVGLAFLSSEIAVERALGVAVAVGVTIELLVGMWLLRPVVQGERAAGIKRARSTTLLKASLPERSARLLDAPESLVDSDIAPEWRRVVGGLLRAEFDCQADPATAELASVFVEETPLFEEVSNHNARLIQTGLRVQGDGPKLRALDVVNTSSPIAISVTVEHPRRYLIDASDRQIGQRNPELREGMLWLMQDPSGRYRIAEAIDLGEAEPAIEPAVDLTQSRRSTDVPMVASELTADVTSTVG